MKCRDKNIGAKDVPVNGRVPSLVFLTNDVLYKLYFDVFLKEEDRCFLYVR